MSRCFDAWGVIRTPRRANGRRRERQALAELRRVVSSTREGVPFALSHAPALPPAPAMWCELGGRGRPSGGPTCVSRCPYASEPAGPSLTNLVSNDTSVANPMSSDSAPANGGMTLKDPRLTTSARNDCSTDEVPVRRQGSVPRRDAVRRESSRQAACLRASHRTCDGKERTRGAEGRARPVCLRRMERGLARAGCCSAVEQLRGHRSHLAARGRDGPGGGVVRVHG
jgi:hypothetical protein